MRSSILLLTLVLASRIASACKCPDPRPTALEALPTADAVFDGTVVSRTPFLQRFGLRLAVLERRSFLVHEAWRGPSQPRIAIVGGYTPFSCDPRFDVGSRYLVFAYSSRVPPLGFQTSICVPTRPYGQSSQALRDLGPGLSFIPPTAAHSERPGRRRFRIVHSSLLFGIASSVDLLAGSEPLRYRLSSQSLLGPLVLLAAISTSGRLALRRRYRLLAWLLPAFVLAIAMAVSLQGFLVIRSDLDLAHRIIGISVGA
jgi:hypothetical protein